MSQNLINCPDCQNPTSKDAANCPKCGKKLKRTITETLAYALLFIFLFTGISFIVGYLGSS